MDPAARPSHAELLAHARWVEELARRVIRDPAAADDLAQSAWVAALATPSSPRTDLRAWWSRIVRNLASESRRREAQRSAVEREAARDERAPSGAELAARADAQREVVAAVLALDELHRDVLLLRYFEGLSPREIARSERVPLATIASRITRAHAKLRERLERPGASWLAALAPLARRSDTATRFPWSTLVMSTSMKAAISVAAIAAVVWWLAPSREATSVAATPAPVVVHDLDASVPATLASEPSATTARAPAAASATPAPAQHPKAAPSSEPDSAAPSTAPVAASIGARIRGQVFRPDGEPAPGGKVRFQRTGGGPIKTIDADSEGRFDERELPAGKWHLSSSPTKKELELLTEPTKSLKMEWLAQRQVVIADGAEVYVELGKPPPQPIFASGRITGVPTPARGIVTWTPVGDAGQDRAKIGYVREDATYEHRLDEPGSYVVMIGIRPGMNFERRVEVPRAAVFAHDFEAPRGALLGLVRTKDGAPVAKAKVEVVARSGIAPPRAPTYFSWVQTTDEHGRFSFAALEPARYAVSVHDGTAGGVGALGAACERDVVLSEGANVELELTLAPGVVVRGKVTSASNGPTHYTQVFAFDARGEPVNPLNAAPSNVEGAFTLPALVAGRYTVVGARGDAWTDSVELVLKEGEEPQDLELVLKPAALLEVAGEGLGDAWIDVRDAAGNVYSGVLDRNVFNGTFGRDCRTSSWSYFLPQGNYEVRAVGAGGVVASARAAGIGGETVRVALRR